MKLKSILFFSLLVAAGLSAMADEGQGSANGFSLGWNISSFANNYGLGAEVLSPRYLDGKIHFALSADYAWVQGMGAASTQTSWFGYTLLRLGVFGDHWIEGIPVRLYGGGGALTILPTTGVSATSSVGGGYGLVGLEFFMNHEKSREFFTEFGGMGTGAVADKLVGQPLYADGFSISWGFRYFL